MEVKELRIGNWVEFDGETMVIDGIMREGDFSLNPLNEFNVYLRSINGETIIWAKAKKANPIHLTEERLLKFGFEKWPKRNTFEWKDGDYRSIQIELNKTSCEIYLCGCYSATSQESFHVDAINFVHQLQNLFFALTGKELTINK